MPDIRLAVIAPHVADRAGVAARLRGATVVAEDDPVRFRGPPAGPDAALAIGLGRTLVEPMLASGIHVALVADPCPRADEVEALYAAARTAGVTFAVVNPDRYLPSRQLLRKQLPTPLGEPGLIRSHRWTPATDNPTDPPHLPGPLLLDLDVALWLAGQRPDRVYAIEPKAEGVAGRYVQVHLGFPGGGMAVLDFTNRLPAGDGYQSLSVIAAGGAAYADDHQNVQLVYGGGHPRAVRTEERAGQLAAVAQEFVDAIGPGGGRTGADEWRTVFAVAEAVRRSLADGRPVPLEGR
jgi:predicted dehydrogenase